MVRQAENFLALMNNYNNALDYTTVAAESAGTAEAKFASYTDSVAASQKRVTASFEGLSSALLNNGTYSGVLDIISGMLSGVTGIVKNLGTIPTLIAAITVAMSIMGKNAGRQKGVVMPIYFDRFIINERSIA